MDLFLLLEHEKHGLDAPDATTYLRNFLYPALTSRNHGCILSCRPFFNFIFFKLFFNFFFFLVLIFLALFLHFTVLSFRSLGFLALFFVFVFIFILLL